MPSDVHGDPIDASRIIHTVELGQPSCRCFTTLRRHSVSSSYQVDDELTQPIGVITELLDLRKGIDNFSAEDVQAGAVLGCGTPGAIAARVRLAGGYRSTATTNRENPC